MGTKAKDTKAKANTFTVTFEYNKETDKCIRMGAKEKNEQVFGALYVRKEVFPEGCTQAIVTVTFEEN